PAEKGKRGRWLPFAFSATALRRRQSATSVPGLPFLAALLHLELHGERLLVLGLGDHALLLVEHREARARERLVGLELGVATRGVDGAVEVAFLGERHREAVPRHRERLVERQRLAVGLDRLAGAPGGEVRDSSLVVRARFRHRGQYSRRDGEARSADPAAARR